MLKEGALDWRTGEPATVNSYFEDAIDIHHIFPRLWCDRRGISPKAYNSIVNKTPLSARTNRVIGGQAPSTYLRRVANSAEADEFTIDKQVASHLIDPETLRADDFEAFYAARQRWLLERIAAALGKPIQEETIAPLADEEDSDEDDTDDL